MAGPSPPSRVASGGFPVVAIGASAGGLDAFRKLLDALPADSGVALLLVQHLEPTHDSMMAELLAGHTTMPVQQAVDGMLIERRHVYLIPPGAYLSVANGALHLSKPLERHGLRMPFDFLLNSLAKAYGSRAIGVILTGTGADGSRGLIAVKHSGGLVIAQDPNEAAHDGMPRSAISTGAVDLVLPVARIPSAISAYEARLATVEKGTEPDSQNDVDDTVSQIVGLLRTSTPHDFTHYKQGTLRRRIERRMAMAPGTIKDMGQYLENLRREPEELKLLAKDLLIHVSSFFRDPGAFKYLVDKVVPDLVAATGPDRPLRTWIAGCSTGEEAYSLAMLFLEAMAGANVGAKLQVFASDVDPGSVAVAREGFFPKSIEADVSPQRLRRFFSKEDGGYRVSPELRASVIFTVQDVLVDPPFSNIDLISCRNLMIYLEPVAQARLISIFHFALREAGILLLGSAETIGKSDGRFAVVAKSERVYRRMGRSRSSDFPFPSGSGQSALTSSKAMQGAPSPRPLDFAELCRRLVLDTQAPAAVLINRSYDCLYSLGPTHRFLSVSSGHPTHDLLAQARPALRTKLRSAIQFAIDKGGRVTVPGGQVDYDGQSHAFSIDVMPAPADGAELLLICFVIDRQVAEAKQSPAAKPGDLPITELERELAETRAELQSAIRNLEISNEEQRVINEEALSVGEEYQSTNEELLTSKEELQSLNEELTAVNSQLQETLERQRTTSNDLKNVLYSTDVATLFLDKHLNIRFFTPATRSLFSVIPSDIGRPLEDLHSLAVDDDLLSDAREVLRTLVPCEREIRTREGAWYARRVQPYRADGDGVEGVVITFADVTERRRAADALGVAKREAESATAAKSRFLASVSHDLRQPLQTLVLVQGLLAKTSVDAQQKQLLSRLDETLIAMSGMLNTLLDINQIEAGIVTPVKSTVQIGALLERMRDEFTYHAEARKLAFRTVTSDASVHSDPRLLEQIVRNLLSNALKYTRTGKILLGCRRRGDKLSIEIWDTGVGIPANELQAIFEEYHQLDNSARERSRGLGLGLSIAQRLASLLGHQIRVRSNHGRGSVFSIEVELAAVEDKSQRLAVEDEAAIPPGFQQTGAILVIEDDSELRELLEVVLANEGHRVASAPDGPAALDLVARGTIRPDLILADYNLPNGMHGLEAVALIRAKLHNQAPVVILTGDISTVTLRDIARQNCVQLHKPVKLTELTRIIQRLLPPGTSERRTSLKASGAPRAGLPTIYIVDDDRFVRDAIGGVFAADGRPVETFATCEAFLEAYNPDTSGCLLIDAYLPGMSGLELLQLLHDQRHRLPAIMITGSSDVSMAVRAMKAGASDFLEKPISRDDLLASVDRAIEHARDASKLAARQETAASHIASLTARQRQIMDLVLAGHPSKNIAADLGISQRTVENHRASIMKKTGSRSVPALARLAVVAAREVPEQRAPGAQGPLADPL